METRRRFLAMSAAGVACGSFPPALRAQVLDKTTRMIVGFPAGGSADFVARRLSDALRGIYATTVIVESKPGASGRIAVETVKNAEADGSVVLFTPATMLTLFPHVFTNLSYDPFRDLVPVTTVCTFEFGLVVGPTAAVKSTAEFVDWCKANPKKAAYGSPAAGSGAHFLGVMFAKAAGVNLLHVPYKGAVPAMQDVLGGQIASFIGVMSDLIPHHRSGKAQVLATSGRTRSRYLPDVPTFEEAGYKGVAAQEWYGLFVPRKTPADVVNRLNKATLDALKNSDVVAALETLSFEPSGSSPSAFADRVKVEYADWAPVVKASGFKVEE